MSNKPTIIHYANTITEAQTLLRNIQGITIAAGCSEISRRQNGRMLVFPPNVLSIAHVPELTSINKTERFIEFGAAVTLNAISNLEQKKIPDILYSAIQSVANYGTRSIATLGGNISAKGHRLSTFSALLALDARLEIRTATETHWIPMNRFFSNTARKELTPSFISKIRIQSEEWNVSIYRRIGKIGIINESSASFSFLAKFQKNILTDIRIAWAGHFFLKNREFENVIIGRSLPLSQKEIAGILEKAQVFFDTQLLPPSYHRTVFFNLLKDSLEILS